MRRRCLTVAVVAILGLAGCSAEGEPEPTSSEASTTEAATEASTPAPVDPLVESDVDSATYTCLDGQEGVRFFAGAVADREVDAAVVGSGEVGVVLGHQSNGNLCQWWSYALTLADGGYRVIVPSLDGDAAANIRAAAATLAADGVDQVVLIGASMGGTAVITAAPDLETAPLAIVALSAPTSHDGMDALSALSNIEAPMLLAAGTSDFRFADATEQLAAAAPEGTETIFVEDSTRHGVALLGGDRGIDAELEAFLAEHAAP